MGTRGRDSHAKIRKYLVLRREAVIATALWTMMAFSGAETVCQRRTDRSQRVPYAVDREHPTLIIDEADDLFCRKSDLRAIVNAGWSRGTRIPRQGRWYDPFCPKILGILGKTKLPRTIASRSIILKMWPKKILSSQRFAASSHGGLPTISASSRT